ncbi:hypothetical protein OS493_022036 [Desmophyllum pertusum]|uniref:RING-type domain-containing protein n=1 Tax=Desmophyllum pertusum TaxID=174260 RepID=A0A9X0CRV4_9CNID|nr:hypothetical protein OS493_022036 [Desmophyllum pertusum]
MSLLTMHMQDLNPHIMCVLCGGYLVDATTIVECLHSFCRSCIVKYLQSSYHCPVCDAEVHKTKPLLHIRPDRTLQDIVYKIVPGIYHEEVTRRKEFETSQKDKNEPAIEGTTDNETASNEKDNDPLPFADPVCITLEYFRKTRNRMEKEVFPTRYLRCSSEVTVKVLKKFLVMKFAIPETHNTEITRSDEILVDHLTMKEVCRIYGLYSKPFVDLQYVFLEKKDSTTSVEKPKILDVKRKRIKKKKKGNKSLLKKCLGPNTPHRLKNKTGKKKDLSSAQPSENAHKLDMEPSQPRSFENEKKENLVLSPIQLCANVKNEDLVSSKEPPYDNNVKEPSLPAQWYHNCDKARESLLQPNMVNQNGGYVNENEASVLGKSTVRTFNQHDVTETLVNSNLEAVGSSSTVTPISFPELARFWPAMNGESGEEFSITPAVNDLKHAQSDESYYAKEMEMDTSVSNYTNDICMNHISTDLESSAAMLRGIGMLLESL